MKLPSVLGRLTPLSSTQSANLMGGSPQLAVELSVSIPGQTRQFWCWAAVTAGIWKFYDAKEAKPQCEVAALTLQHAPSHCCEPTAASCDRAYYLDRALNAAGVFDSLHRSHLDPAIVLSELKSNRPVCVRIQWPSDAGHFVAVSGMYQTPNGRPVVVVHDPSGPEVHTLTYDELVSNYTSDQGRWTHSYLTTNAAAGGSGLEPMSPPLADDHTLLGG